LTGREGADRVRAHSQALETSLGNPDIPPMAAILEGVAMELADCALPTLNRKLHFY